MLPLADAQGQKAAMLSALQQKAATQGVPDPPGGEVVLGAHPDSPYPADQSFQSIPSYSGNGGDLPMTFGQNPQASGIGSLIDDLTNKRGNPVLAHLGSDQEWQSYLGDQGIDRAEIPQGVASAFEQQNDPQLEALASLMQQYMLQNPDTGYEQVINSNSSRTIPNMDPSQRQLDFLGHPK